MPQKNKNKQWSNYWKQGHITSFGAGTAGNYSSGVKTYWFNCFKSLREGAVILDAATGNGAIAVFAVEYSESFSKDFTVLASDAAVINETIVEESKSLNKYRDKIQFFSSTPCEHLPFDDASIDLVCSQFGIEYSNLNESIPEVGRVLHDDGSFVAIMHHYLSVIVLDAVREQSMLKEALQEYKIFDILKQYCERITDASGKESVSLQTARKKPEVIQYEKKIREAITNLRTKYKNNEHNEILWSSINNYMMKYLSRPKAEQYKGLATLQNSFQSAIDRQDDLREAALSKDAMLNLQRLAIESGFKDLAYEKNLNASFQTNGWNVSARK
jgi:ubiquinone/menaquinone biosynthesis C-methylase UbiE